MDDEISVLVVALIVIFIVISLYKKASQDGSGWSGRYFGPLQAKVVKSKINQYNADLYTIYIRGIIPVQQEDLIQFRVRLFDTHNGNLLPVIAFDKDQREHGGMFFDHTLKVGKASFGSSIVKWMPVSGFIPEIIQPPYSGNRELSVMLEVELDRIPTASLGEVTCNVSVEYTEPGYMEVVDNVERCRELAVSIAIIVAMSDGELHDHEVEIIKKWMREHLDVYSEDNKEEMRQKFIELFKESHAKVLSGEVSITELCNEFSKIADRKAKNDVIEFCMDIMAADGEAVAEEMDVINNLANEIGFDMKELNRIRDEKIVSTRIATNTTDPETVLGIDPSWSIEEKQKQLRKEFQKWNNRISTLPAGEEREAAQNMLNMISMLRKKYDEEAKLK